MTEEKKKTGEISRREFLKDAGLVVGGAAIGSAVILAACAPKGGATETVTKTVGGATVTATTTATKTVEATKTVCLCTRDDLIEAEPQIFRNQPLVGDVDAAELRRGMMQVGRARRRNIVADQT